MDKKTNIKSFRVSDEVLEKFNQLKEEENLTQDGVLSMLIGAYELSKAAQVLPDRATEIENFQMKANELINSYMMSLQINADAEARIRSKVELEMNSKDKTILGLQEKLEGMSVDLQMKNAELNDAKKTLTQMEKDRVAKEEKLDALESSLKDKTRICEWSSAEIRTLKAQLEEYPVVRQELQDTKKQLEETLQQIRDMKKDTELMFKQFQLEKEKEIAELNLANEKTKNDEIQKLQEMIVQLKEEKYRMKETLLRMEEHGKE